MSLVSDKKRVKNLSGRNLSIALYQAMEYETCQVCNLNFLCSSKKKNKHEKLEMVRFLLILYFRDGIPAPKILKVEANNGF